MPTVSCHDSVPVSLTHHTFSRCCAKPKRAFVFTPPGTSHLWFTDGKSSVAAPFRQGQVQLAALEELYPWWPPKAYIVNGYWVGESATPGWGDLDLEAVGALGRTQQQPIPVKRASGEQSARLRVVLHCLKVT